MTVIKTFEGKVFRYEDGATFLKPTDRFSPGFTEMIMFQQNRAKTLYYFDDNRCGVQYLGYENLLELHPYAEWYEKLTPVSKNDYNALSKKINAA